MRLSDKTATHSEGFKIGEVEITDLTDVKETPTFVPKGGSVTRVGGQNIVTIEIPKSQNIQSFEPGRLQDQRGIKYSDALSGVSDSVRRSSRFRVNELTRSPLSIEEEEEVRIEAEVGARLAARLEEVRAAIERDAHDAGFQAGQQEAKEQVLAEAVPRLELFDKLVSEFENMRLEIFKANEQLLLNIVNQLTRAAILRELKDDSDYLKRLATGILEKVGTRENIKIFVSEKEFSTAEQLKAGLAESLGQLKNITIEVDRLTTTTGCRVETEFGEVDARIEVQLQGIAQGLGVEST